MKKKNYESESENSRATTAYLEYHLETALTVDSSLTQALETFIMLRKEEIFIMEKKGKGCMRQTFKNP